MQFFNKPTQRKNTLTQFDSIVQAHVNKYPTPSNLYYVFGIGSLLGILLVIQVITGIFLAMHYIPQIDLAFISIERIMREIPFGWWMRYIHSNGSSAIFMLLYIHIGRGLYFQSYRGPKRWLWVSGVILFIVMSGISFLGYTLPWGQISFWGATVITNLLTAIPIIGSKLVTWVWGGFAITQSTLNRFFSLHYFLSIVVLAISCSHLILLHVAGTTDPIFNDSYVDSIRFYPYYTIKDILTLIIFFIIFIYISIYKSNLLGHPDNYSQANPLVTPAHIVPEWYFLPFYAILKTFPNKSIGALMMLCAMLVLVILPWIDMLLVGNLVLVNHPQFNPTFSIICSIFVSNFIILGWLGSCSVSDTTQFWMQICTGFYFFYFIFFIPFYLFNQRIMYQKLI